MEFALKRNFKLKMLIVGGVIAGATAIWHLLMIAGGPSWYAFGHAPQYIIESAKQNTLTAPIAAVIIASLMFACSAYSFSGAGLIRKIPFLKSALITISIICLGRALITVPYFFRGKMDTWNFVAGLGWFIVGVCFLIGAIEQFSKKSKDI